MGMTPHDLLKGLRLPIITAALFTPVAPMYAADGEAIYIKNCRKCHGTNLMGAPKAGDAAAWKPRLAKGHAALYNSAINGFRDRSIMPARGDNRNLSDDEVKAAVDYMVGLVE
jgi:cytochrome c5